MKLNWTHGAALLACVAMSGCGMIGGGSKAPKGQVVATVNGEPANAITGSEPFSSARTRFSRLRLWA